MTLGEESSHEPHGGCAARGGLRMLYLSPAIARVLVVGL